MNLDKPEYFFRPGQLVRRLLRASGAARSGKVRKVHLPWGLSVPIDPQEALGRSLWHLGIYDLAVSEVLWRLIEAGDQAADVGANFGYMTSLMARRVGPRGTVHAFEPHPLLFGLLSENVEGWKNECPGDLGSIQLHRAGVAAKSGSGTLCVPKEFSGNQGLSYLKGAENRAQRTQEFEVRLVTLDEMFTPESAPRIIKIDVEGMEFAVLKGSERLLRSGRIENIVFEDHGEAPTPPMRFLEGLGYEVYRIQRRFFRPKFVPVRQPISLSVWEPPSFLATRDRAKVKRKLSGWGWRALRADPHNRESGLQEC